MSAMHLAWRLTRRQALRDWWRWLLGGLLIGAALSLGALVLAMRGQVEPDAIVVVTTAHRPAPRTVQIDHGSDGIDITGEGAPKTHVALTGGFSQEGVAAPGGAPTEAGPLHVSVPNEADVAVGRAITIRARTAHRAARFAVTDIAGGRVDAILPLVDGRMPRGSNEIVLPQQTMNELQITVGSDIEVVSPAMPGRHMRVVGRVDDKIDGSGQNGAWGRVDASTLDAQPIEARVVVVDLPGRSGNTTSGGSSGSEGTSSVITNSFFVRDRGGSAPGMIEIALALYMIVPLLLPMLAVSTIFAVGLERQAAERTSLVRVGAPGWIWHMQTVMSGLLTGLVATLAALSIASVRDEPVTASYVIVPVLLVGLALGIGAAVAAARRAGRFDSHGIATRPVRVRTLVASAVVCAASGIAIHVLSERNDGVFVAPLVLLLAASVIMLLSLSGVLVRVLTRLTPTPAARVSLTATTRVRWLSTPAAGLIGLASVLAFLVSSSVSAPTTPQYTAAHRLVLPGSLIDDQGRQIAPQRAVVDALAASGISAEMVALRRVSGRTCAPPDWATITAELRGGISPMFAASAADIGRLAGGVSVTANADVILLGAASIGTASVCADGRGWSPRHAPATAHLDARDIEGIPGTYVTPASATAVGLVVHEPPMWVVRPDHALSGDEVLALSRNLAAQGLSLDRPEVSSVWSVPRRAVDAVVAIAFVVLCSIALLLAAVERRPERRLLRAVGVSPRDERIAEATATGGLALAGVASGAGVLALVYLTASGGDIAEMVRAIGRSWVPALIIGLVPVAAGAFAFLAVRTRSAARTDWAD